MGTADAMVAMDASFLMVMLLLTGWFLSRASLPVTYAFAKIREVYGCPWAFFEKSPFGTQKAPVRAYQEPKVRTGAIESGIFSVVPKNWEYPGLRV
jgi:hypothetical protein